MIRNITKLDLVSVPLPTKTDSYEPVSNQQAIDLVEKIIQSHGYTIADSRFSMNSTGQIATGVHTLQGIEDEGIGLQVGWMNSYNKMKAFSIGVGGTVFVCNNGMFIAPFKSIRKHTKKVHNDLETLIDNTVKEAEHQLIRLTKAKKNFQSVHFDKSAQNEILGEMFFERDMLTAHQANIIKNQISQSENFAMDSDENRNMWNLYSNITEALKHSHPMNYFDSHLDAFEFIKEKTIAEHAKQLKLAEV